MIDTGLLAEAFERNTWIIRAQTEGLDHAACLIQTPYRINCLNWTLGHILDGRGRLLEMAGAEPVLSGDETSRYRRESDPVLEDGPGVLPLQRLLQALDETQARMSAALGALDEAAFSEETDVGDGRMMSLAARFHFGYFHDTYHTGQTELLRQVTGVGDKVI